MERWALEVLAENVGIHHQVSVLKTGCNNLQQIEASESRQRVRLKREVISYLLSVFRLSHASVPEIAVP